uniref:Uncharacterized protein n=1 Tax=Knipowitschia caucasica TaxID=637954 RepID=A0AAV2JA20_KNICA
MSTPAQLGQKRLLRTQLSSLSYWYICSITYNLSTPTSAASPTTWPRPLLQHHLQLVHAHFCSVTYNLAPPTSAASPTTWPRPHLQRHLQPGPAHICSLTYNLSPPTSAASPTTWPRPHLQLHLPADPAHFSRLSYNLAPPTSAASPTPWPRPLLQPHLQPGPAHFCSVTYNLAPPTSTTVSNFALTSEEALFAVDHVDAAALAARRAVNLAVVLVETAIGATDRDERGPARVLTHALSPTRIQDHALPATATGGQSGPRCPLQVTAGSGFVVDQDRVDLAAPYRSLLVLVSLWTRTERTSLPPTGHCWFWFRCGPGQSGPRCPLQVTAGSGFVVDRDRVDLAAPYRSLLVLVSLWTRTEWTSLPPTDHCWFWFPSGPGQSGPRCPYRSLLVLVSLWTRTEWILLPPTGHCWFWFCSGPGQSGPRCPLQVTAGSGFVVDQDRVDLTAPYRSLLVLVSFWIGTEWTSLPPTGHCWLWFPSGPGQSGPRCPLQVTAGSGFVVDRDRVDLAAPYRSLLALVSFWTRTEWTSLPPTGHCRRNV